MSAKQNGVRRIMMVDDDAGVRESLRQLFKHDKRFSVVSEHARAKDAINKLTDLHPKQRPDLVLLDIVMPGMDGISACWKLRRYFPSLTIAMFTARTAATCFEPARVAGADAYLVKATRKERLVETLYLLSCCDESCLCVGEAGSFKPTLHGLPGLLTPREIEVLDYVSTGGIYKQAAEHFCCSESNIKKTIARAIRHLNAKTKAHAIRLWLDEARGVPKATFHLRDYSGKYSNDQ